MRRRSLRPTSTTTLRPSGDELCRRWLSAVRTPMRSEPPGLDSLCQEVVEALLRRPDQLPEVLTRFGRELGIEGWLLAEVTGWITELRSIAQESGVPLRTFEAGVALVSGWADGSLYSLQGFDCTDGLTGLATLPVLRLRLGQVYDQCASLGVPADQVYCLAVLDTDFGDRPPLERDAAMVVIGDQVLQAYRGGETTAIKDGRVLILTSRTETTYAQFRDLLTMLHHYPLLAGGHMIGWIEELPANVDQLDRYLVDLAA